MGSRQGALGTLLLVLLSATATPPRRPRAEASAWPEGWLWLCDPLQVTPPSDDCDFYNDSPAPLFRAEMNGSSLGVDESTKAATLNIAGLGFFEAFLNGQRLGNGTFFEPGFTSFNTTVLYSSFDVLPLLLPSGSKTTHDSTRTKSGQSESENDETFTFGVALGNGWWSPLPLRFWGGLNLRDSLAVGTPRFTAWLTVTGADGSRTMPLSSASPELWRVGDSEVLRNDIYLGEVVDGRLEPRGWNEGGFSDEDWRQATHCSAPRGKPTPQYVPPVRRRADEELKPVNITALNSSTWIVDFGRNFAGVASLPLKAGVAAGTTVKMRFGELLWPNGSLNVMTSVAGQIKSPGMGGPCAPAVAEQSDTYIARGSREDDSEGETFLPRWTWHAFRFMELAVISHGHSEPSPGGEVDSDVVDWETMRGFPMHNDLTPTATFDSSDERLQAIFDLAVHTHLSNMMGGIQSDCPHRERFGYGGDALATAETALALWDMRAFYGKRVRDFNDAAREEEGGIMFTETAPFVGISDGGLGGDSGPIGWDSLQPVLQVYLLDYYGPNATIADNSDSDSGSDTILDLLRSSFNTTRSWIQALEAAPAELIENGLGDWMALEAKSLAMTGQGFVIQNLRAFSRICEALGEQDLSLDFAAKAAAAVDAFNGRFLRSDGVYAESDDPTVAPSQCGQAMALALNIPPNDTMATAVAQQLVRAVRSPQAPVDGPAAEAESFLAAGMFAVKWVLLELAKADENDVAYQVVTQGGYPSFGFMLDQGASTIWESWYFSNNTFSHNHPMFSSVVVWMLRSIAGLEPHSSESSNPRAYGVHPRPPSQLCGHSVNSSLETPQGTLAVSWTWTHDEQFELHLSVPPETTVHVSLPSDRSYFLALEQPATAPHVPRRIPGGLIFDDLDYDDRRLALPPILASGSYSFSVLLHASQNNSKNKNQQGRHGRRATAELAT